MITNLKELTAHPKVRESIIHPFAFAVFPVLSLYVRNIGKGFFREAMGIATGVFVLAVLLWLFIGLFVKDRNKSAIIVSAFFVLFFSYSHAISAVRVLLEWVHLLNEVKFLVTGDSALLSWLVIWGVLFVAAFFFTVKSASDLRPVTKFLNVVALTLMVVVGVNFVAGGVYMYLPPRVRAKLARVDEDIAHSDSAQSSTNLRFRQYLPLCVRIHPDLSAFEEAIADQFTISWQEGISAGNTLSGSSPDIYYIILDMYARADVLEDVYHYDNSEFLSFLTDKGFYVASKSRTNYHHTLQSLASSLNLMYLDGIAEQMGRGYTNIRPLTVMVKSSKVMQYLRDRGYTIVTFSTGHEFTDNKEVDVYLKPNWWHPSQFQRGLMETTPFATLQKTRDDFHRSRILYIVDHLADATQIDGPTFVFAHILAPHPPYAFGPNGEPVQSKPHEEYEYDEFIEVYRNQVSHINMRIRTAIEEILSQSPEQPIIIVQADHGAAFRNETIRARIPILNVYYFPDQNYDALYEGITPVNTFRVVFNNYFGTDYELLEDRSYFVDSPYLYTDVTDESLSDD